MMASSRCTTSRSSTSTREWSAGSKALIRWEHPELGLLHPAEFIELTELNNLNREVVLTVVRQGLETLSRWRHNGADVGLSVNIGGRTLADTELIGEIVDLVAEARLPKHSFGIELTERHLLLDTQATLRSLERLAAADIWLSIDDFGTGSSSLWALRQIPANELKIDRSFVEDLRRGQSGIIRSIVAMAHDLGLEVVAEGVEDEVTYQWLRDSGCDHVQGYLVAPPMPAWQVELMFQLPCRPGRARSAPRLRLDPRVNRLGRLTSGTFGRRLGDVDGRSVQAEGTVRTVGPARATGLLRRRGIGPARRQLQVGRDEAVRGVGRLGRDGARARRQDAARHALLQARVARGALAQAAPRAARDEPRPADACPPTTPWSASSTR